MEPFIGQIILFSGNKVPKGWALCDGSLLNTSDNQSLFAVIFNTFGGNGTTTFALPDLRGRFPMNPFHNTIAYVQQGTIYGHEKIEMPAHYLPAHNHTVQVSIPVTENDAENNQAGGLLSIASNDVKAYGGAADGSVYSGQPISGDTQNAGASAPIDNMQPSLVLNYIIATTGIFPPRS